ncbi:sulfotransferase family 2 domain-containing protein [Falsiroseomonas sp. HC035]|uniref:sulfotransferase family 2 domain-containing protein n=1 Tax=Falsiroseomonas sp. HC035 TaxID=3390999 RepID=UPI003D315B6B
MFTPSSATAAAPMELLYSGRIGDYLSAAAFGDAPCIFVHVPKTAGTSLRAELATLLPPDINIHVDYADASRSFNDRLDDAVTRFLERAPEGIRFASGHIQARHATRIAKELPAARFVTLLRDPVARVVSDYRHQCSPRQPGFEAFRARVPDLEAYLDLTGERDKAAVHLLPPDLRRRGDVAACVDFIERRFIFVGIQEMYATSFRLITALAGRSRAPRLRENVGLAEPAEVTGAMAARIRALNPLDSALYDHFAGRLRAVEPLLTEALGA